MLPPCVLWVDPGKMTGLAWLGASTYEAVMHYPGTDTLRAPEASGHTYYVRELDFMKAGDALEAVCGWYGPLAWVGWEKFHIGPRTPAADAHHAIEMIGVTRRIATKHGCRILTPADPDDRKVASPAILSAIGWWIPGKDDAQSAAAHLLAWLLRTGNVPSDLGVRLATARQGRR
jgi:hypothetical protein